MATELAKRLEFQLHATTLALLLSLTACVHKYDGGCHHSSDTFRCVQYVRNYDGDTITVTIKDVHPLVGQEISVRVAGIDTPEIRTKDPCEKAAALSARDYVETLLRKARRIDLLNVSRDKYFRILADVEVDGKSLGPTLLNEGYAFAYDGGSKARPDWCQRTVNKEKFKQKQALPVRDLP